LQFEPSIQKEQRASRFALGLAYCVVHASGLFAFLTLRMATSGLEFFHFYPRQAETILQPFALHTMMWLGTAAFSMFGLIVLRRFAAGTAQERMSCLSLLTVILAASISFALPVVSGFPDLVPFWWIGAAAVAFCWLGFGYGIASYSATYVSWPSRSSRRFSELVRSWRSGALVIGSIRASLPA
jgi:hypothetical protein